MKQKRFLPQYVTAFTDRHGKMRLRFRRTGYESHYFAAPFGTEAFRAELRQCLSGKIDTAQQAVARTIPGTVDDAITRYFSVPARLGPTDATQRKVRAILERFRAEHGHRNIADFRFDHIEKIIDKRLAKTPSANGKRIEGGPEAARKLRKELVRFFDFTIRIEMRDSNPASQASRVKVAAGERSKGFHTWTEAEIAQFYERHPVGTKARLAMDLMLWTGQRRGDMIRFSKDDLIDGRIPVRQAKGGKELLLPLAPQLVASIVTVPKVEGQKTYLVHAHGKPFKNASFGNWFRERCDEAGLPQCTAHGLRKAMMRRLAELHLGNQSLKSVSGHTRDDEVATYTRDVNQARMADHAIRLLSEWEQGRGEPNVLYIEHQPGGATDV